MLGKIIAGLGLSVCLMSCVSYAPGPVSITVDRDQEGRIFFTTTDAYDFADLVAGAAPTRVIHGDLQLPPPGTTLRGAVILSHGSGGVSSLHRRYADWLTPQGLAVFLLDHFSPRNVGSTARDQIKVTAQGMLADVIAAQQLLSTHPDLEPGKIGHIGWSKGGIVALSAAVERFAGYAKAPEPLAFAAAFYPFCGFSLEQDTLASPLLIQIGENDNWTPAAPCRDLVDDLQNRGQSVELVVYPGATHGFDSRFPETDFSSAVTVRKVTPTCLLKIDQDGRTISQDDTHALTSPDGRIAYLRDCGERGVTYGGNSDARDASLDRLKDLIDRALP